jgi:PAS domain S-box-containing protein
MRTVHPRAPRDGWSALFATAFAQSRNAMVLVDEHRCVVDANGAYVKLLGCGRDDVIRRPVYMFIVGGPRATRDEWADTIAAGRFCGEAELERVDGTRLTVQWGASTEVVTGRRLVLFVVLTTSRWGHRFRRDHAPERPAKELTQRECEIVALVALGGTAREIAEELHISHQTVRTHVRNAMEKLHARSRAHLVAKALASGVVPL